MFGSSVRLVVVVLPNAPDRLILWISILILATRRHFDEFTSCKSLVLVICQIRDAKI